MKVKTWKSEAIELNMMEELSLRLVVGDALRKNYSGTLHPATIERLREINRKLWE